MANRSPPIIVIEAAPMTIRIEKLSKRYGDSTLR